MLRSTFYMLKFLKPSCRFEFGFQTTNLSDRQKVLKDLLSVAAGRRAAHDGNGDHPGGATSGTNNVGDITNNGDNGTASNDQEFGGGNGNTARGTNNAGDITNNGNNGAATNKQSTGRR